MPASEALKKSVCFHVVVPAPSPARHFFTASTAGGTSKIVFAIAGCFCKNENMRGLLLLLILFVSLFAIAAPEPDGREQFLTQYYAGEYEKAHSLLSAITDPAMRQIWENRIHVQQNDLICPAPPERQSSSAAFAQFCIGEFEAAQKLWTDDWLSHWGKATYAHWNSDVLSARKHVQQALVLQPEYPELLFLAGDIAETPQQTIDYFQRFLKLDSADAVKRNIADFSIQFLQKTKDMQLNIVRVEPGVQELETDYENSGLVIRGILNSTEKMKLVVDTGAGSGLVLERRKWTPQVVNDVVMLGLGKRQINQSKRIVLNQFSSGKFSIQNPLATENETMPLPDMDGLIGSAVFGSHQVLLPVKSRKNVALIPHDVNPEDYFTAEGLKFKNKITVPFFLVNKLILIKGRIKKSPAVLDIMVDTGADVSLISMASAKKYASINYPLSMQLRRQATVSGVGGKADNLLIAENVEVGIGELSRNFNSMLAINFAESSEALELEIDLLLGRDFLQGYTLLIDYKNRQLTFLR